MKRLFLLALALVLPACSLQSETTMPISPFSSPNPECILVFATDRSPRIRQELTTDTGLFDFWVDTIDNYFRDRIGHEDLLIITDVTTNCNIDMFNGTPTQFRQTIDSAEALRNLLAGDDRPDSHPFDVLADRLDYLITLPGVREHRTPVYVVVMARMVDDADPEKLVTALKRFREAGGDIRFYWAEDAALPTIEKIMVDGGYPKPHWMRTWQPPPLRFMTPD